jgi:hypothetical protein
MNDIWHPDAEQECHRRTSQEVVSSLRTRGKPIKALTALGFEDGIFNYPILCNSGLCSIAHSRHPSDSEESFNIIHIDLLFILRSLSSFTDQPSTLSQFDSDKPKVIDFIIRPKP